MIYMITYDLKAPGKNYNDLIDEIKNCSTGKWCTYWKSSYLIQSTLTVNQISDKLNPYLDSNDKLIIIKTVRNYQGWLSKDEWSYIQDMFDTDKSF